MSPQEGGAIKVWDADAPPRAAGPGERGASPALSVVLDSAMGLNPSFDVNPAGSLMVTSNKNLMHVYVTAGSVTAAEFAARAGGDAAATADEEIALLDDDDSPAEGGPPAGSGATPELALGEPQGAVQHAVLLAGSPDGSPAASLKFLYSGGGLVVLLHSGSHKAWRSAEWAAAAAAGGAEAGGTHRFEEWAVPGAPPMVNDLPTAPPPAGASAGCIALSRNDSYLLSCSSDQISIYYLGPPVSQWTTFTAISKFRSPKAAAGVVPTAFAFQPGDNNLVALGHSNGAVLVYSVQEAKARRPGASAVRRGVARPTISQRGHSHGCAGQARPAGAHGNLHGSDLLPRKDATLCWH